MNIKMETFTYTKKELLIVVATMSKVIVRMEEYLDRKLTPYEIIDLTDDLLSRPLCTDEDNEIIENFQSKFKTQGDIIDYEWVYKNFKGDVK